MTDYSSLFEPIELGNLELSNRIVMAPMTRSFSPGNIPGDDVVEYYRRRAAGGVGLIITEGIIVDHKASSGYPNVPSLHGERALDGWQKVVDAVHAEGGKIAPQLWHVGGIRRPGIEPGGDLPGYSPSGMARPGKHTGHAMTRDDILEAIDGFARSAGNAKEIGFDALEIHGAHGYLIDQFFWDATNERTDEYGGDLAARSRFAIEVIEAVRSTVGEEFTVMFRWSQWKQQDYTTQLVQNPEQLGAFLEPLSEAGVDIFHCSTRRFWEPEFEGSDLNLAGWTKKLTGKPTITVGSVGLGVDFLPTGEAVGFNSSEPAEHDQLDQLTERVEANEFDLVAVGRALLANPDWANKIKSGDVDGLAAFDKAKLGQLV